MDAERDQKESETRAASQFTTTHWSVVLTAGEGASPEAAKALDRLCRAYWYPLYAYVRRRGYSCEDAKDLTQEFFARLLDKQALAHLEREGGKFRSFLLKALNHFLVNEWEHHRAQKRDERRIAFSLDELAPESRYQYEPADEATPERLFDRQWAATLLDQVLNRLREQYAGEGKTDLFQRLQPCLTGAEQKLPYAGLAAQLRITENAVKMAVHRLRRRYGDLLRAEIAHTVASPQEVEDEIRYLIAMAVR
jgi:RNA polymerase sigma factor (sigma-70 family)